ncbi:HupE/UreJ family protein [soil metagenome]
MKSKLWTAIGLTLVFVQVASAHPGHNHDGFLHGLAHPLSGMDHLLAMLAVGMWAALLGGSAVWRLPVTFACMMIVGGLAARMQVALPAVEFIIAASVLVFGVALAVWIKPSAAAASVLVGAFAIFHGYAHVAELGQDQNAARYALGFFVAMIALHAVGISLGFTAKRAARVDFARWSGAAIGAYGLGLYLGVL